MKKNFLMFAAVAAAFSLSACSNDDQENIVLAPEKENTVVTPDQENITVTPEGYKVTFTAGMGNGATSKTTIAGDDGLDIWFTKDDWIEIYDANGQESSDVTITLPDGKETSPTCTITATFPETPKSPYKAYSYGDNTFKWNGNIDYWIEYEQSPAEGSFDPRYHIMMAKTETDDYNFRFSTRNSFFRFTAPCDLLGATLTATKGEAISGEYYEKPDGTIVIDEDWEESSIKILTPMKAGKTYYISLIPNTFQSGSLQLRLYPTYNTYMTYTVNKPFEAKVNKVHTFKSIDNLPVENGLHCVMLGQYLASPDCPDEPTVYLEDYDGYNLDIKVLKNTSKKVKLILPEGLKTIPEFAFKDCISIASIEMPNSVTSIGFQAFYGCSGITGNFVIPNGVTYIGNSVFDGCSNITSINIPNRVKTLGGKIFDNCTNLTDLTIDMATIKANVFDTYNSITKITVGPNVNAIENNAFASLFPKLETLIIPNTIKSVPQDAFYALPLVCKIHVTTSLKTWFSEQYYWNTMVIDKLIDDVPEN